MRLEIMRDARANFERELVEFNGEPSRVRQLVHSINGVSSRRMRQELPGLRRHYRHASRLRSGSSSPGWPTGAGLDPSQVH